MNLLHFIRAQVDANQPVIADVTAGVSVAAAGYAWLGAANDIVQFIASCVALVAGIAATWWHVERIRNSRADRAAKNRGKR